MATLEDLSPLKSVVGSSHQITNQLQPSVWPCTKWGNNIEALVRKLLWGRRTTKGVLPEDIEVWASLQPVFECLGLRLAQRARRVGCRI